MHTHNMLRIIAVIAASAATVSLANAAAAQDDAGSVAEECGAGLIEVCGERTTYECGWEWGWTFVPYFPYRGYLPHYSCDQTMRTELYKYSTRVPRTQTAH